MLTQTQSTLRQGRNTERFEAADDDHDYEYPVGRTFLFDDVFLPLLRMDQTFDNLQ